ncbi:MAG: hypothetical protein AAFO06_25055, partial [Cyanobacteria bacterium J06597_16]
AKVLLAVIGPTWLDELQFRQNKPETDWVHSELKIAFAFGITVIPVLVGGAEMPKAESLPVHLQALVTLNAAQVRSGRDFQTDMARLIERLEEIVELTSPSVVGRCRDHAALAQYLSATTVQLQQKGSLAMRQKVNGGGLEFNRVAKILGFEPGLGMRGEALFIFAEFAELNLAQLHQFSSQALTWARGDVNPKSAGQAFYNFRVPTHLCFAVAIVDSLDEATRRAIKSTNPMKQRVDVLWYEVPVVYELAESRLHYYAEAASFWENFRGEIAWRQLRVVIRELLAA